MRAIIFLLATSGCVVPAPPDPNADTDPEPEVDTEVDTQEEEVVSTGLQVLLLGDGAADDQVKAGLEAFGHQVRHIGVYDMWDGSNPRPAPYDAVIFLQSQTWNANLSAAADQALVDYVAGGGGLIRSERAAYAAAETQAMAIDDGMPVTYTSEYDDNAEWWAVLRDHELVDELPALWVEPATFTNVRAKSEATVVFETKLGDIPLVSYRTDQGGTYVHINHDLTATTETLGENFLGLLSNAVTFVAQ